MTKSKSKKTSSLNNQANKGFSGPSKAEMSAAVHELCAVTNPFCDQAQGAPSPYGASTFTVPYTNRVVGSFTTGASGEGYIAVRATPYATNYINSAEASTTWAIRTGYDTAVGSPPSFISEARVVSAGVRWWPINAMTSARGTTVIVPMPDCSGFFDGTAPSLLEMVNSPQVHVCSIDDEGCYIMGPQSPDSRDFIEAGAATPTDTQTGFDNVLIAVTGAASTTYLGFEIVINYEGLVDTTQSFIGGQQHAPKSLATAFFKNSRLWSGYVQAGLRQLDDITKGKASKFLKEQLIGIIPGGKAASTAYNAYNLLTNGGVPDVD